jgi:hypothetical protein
LERRRRKEGGCELGDSGSCTVVWVSSMHVDHR